MSNKDINYALVEEKRPAIYTAMKYWGKKPHNIWREYIDCYTPKNGTFLDPFSGSAMGAFEAINLGKTAYAFDLNPLTSFLIEVLSSKYDETRFVCEVNRIFDEIKKDSIYKKNFECKCKYCNNHATIVNYKWNTSKIYEIAIECPICKKRYTINEDLDAFNIEFDSKDLKYWFPSWKFNSPDAFSQSFIKNIGGNSFADIWTKRNLYILSKIFNCIILTKNNDVKKQLLFGFIQTLHLCSKMCVPRGKSANRDFSTSWGRSAYICSKKQMEMNPFHLFMGNCIGKQSVQSSLKSANSYLKTKPLLYNVNISKHVAYKPNLYYGVVDIKKIDSYIQKDSIDFILTDPPYGGLVRYFDLSSIWLSWLSKIDDIYIPDFKNEIMISNNDNQKFYDDFVLGLKALYKVLKPNGKIVFTFNNKDDKIWNMFLNSISDSGFKIEKVIHQQNKRTGESNISSKFGMSSSDFYIRCVKSNKQNRNKEIDQKEYENFIVNSAFDIIKERNEPTNFDVLFAGLLGKLSIANLDIKNCNTNIESILNKHINKEFVVVFDNGTKWALKKKNSRKESLSTKVERTIKEYCDNHQYVNKDSLLGLVFRKFPNGMTPDPVIINDLITKYVKRS